jgi:NosR/NirI family nitrous oxide reductase transcriptional regulator
MILAWLLAIVLPVGQPQAADLDRYLGQVPAGELVPGADSYGPPRGDLPVVPALADGKPVGWVFLNADFAASTGYSGKPIHILVGLDQAAKITGAKLVKHYEPIVLVGIPEQRIKDVIGRYVGLDMAKEAAASGEGHKLDIISGATVTIMVIDDSIVRSGLKVARALGLGGLQAEVAGAAGPRRVIDTGKAETRDWLSLLGDGSVRRLTLDVGMINDAFARSGDAEAAARPEQGDPADTYVDLYVAQVSIPTIGKSLLGEAEYQNRLAKLVAEGRQAILVAGRGRYSWKGSGYVRGGLFDRIQLIQGDRSIRFRDRDHGRLGGIAAEGAPALNEVGLFVLPKDAGFDPAQPWRLQLLAQRATGPTAKAFLTYDLSYEAPAGYFKTVAAAPQAAPTTSEVAPAPVGEARATAAPKLWERIWHDRLPEVAFLGVLLVVLTGTFFFQSLLVRHERLVQRFRTGFLVIVLVWLGWYANAQLSVVNVMTFSNALLAGFSWDHFLMDPLVFTLWFAVAAALIFWGRGAYCGWLCPFGALQELTNKLAKRLKVPQWQVPWALHERLWPIKYIIFLVLFGVSLYSLDTAERLAEVEPFKTAIILKFVRAWPFVLFTVGLLVAGLFVERFYCRYLCALGAALAIPARLRTFEWLKRYRECGNPCQRCSNECMVQAIHPEGHINPNECVYCLHCQVLYVSDTKCPVCIQKRLKRERRKAVLGDSPARPVLPKPKPAAPKPAATPAE